MKDLHEFIWSFSDAGNLQLLHVIFYETKVVFVHESFGRRNSLRLVNLRRSPKSESIAATEKKKAWSTRRN